jgi:hypothetical protein
MNLGILTSVVQTAAAAFLTAAAPAYAYQNCSPQEDTSIEAALISAKAVIPIGLKEIADAASKTNTYQTWFGAYDAQRAAFVKKNLQDADKLLKGTDLTLRCSIQPEIGCGVLGSNAFVDVANAPKTVNFCAAYFNGDAAAQRGDLIHELIHVLISKAGDPHPVLSPADAKKLLPADAVKSAYNYGYWFQF